MMNQKAINKNLMKTKILMAINPIHVENIFNGTKKYEYRKQNPNKKIDKILIYETNPKKLIVGEVEVLDIYIDTPKNIWELTKQGSGINELFFYNYFKDRQVSCAYKLGKVKRYKIPKHLNEFNIKQPPQSFVYI